MTGWELLRAARDGDRDAFGEFYRRYRPIVAGYMHGRGVHRDDVDDLTSEVFIRAWRHLDTVTEQRDDPAAWLFTIARNHAIDRARSAGATPRELVAEIPEPRRPDLGHAGRPSAEAVAMEAIDRAATAAHVRKVVAGLVPGQQQALTAYLDGRSDAEEAARIGSTRNTITVRRFRAIRAARTALTHALTHRTPRSSEVLHDR